MKTSQRQTSLFTEETSTSSPEAFPASHTQWQEKDWGKRTSDTSGPKCLESFVKLPRATSWAKTYAALLIGMEGWSSTRCKLIWKLSATKSSRYYFQLVPSVLRIDAIASGLLPTVTAFDSTNASANMKSTQVKEGSMHSMTLSRMMSEGMLPTPIKSDCTPARPSKNWQGSDLGGFINRGNTGKIFQLNPQFVAEMMGFPTDWTESPFQSGETKA